MYRKFGKRILDILCVLLALIVFCWLYALIALLVRIKLGSPVIFKQDRPGKDEKIFTLYKFRTMTDARDEAGNLLPDTARLTPFGKWIRSTSLDEIPEAVNILKGDMSVVGPRPLLVEYLPLYSEEQKSRHTVRPGLTGQAQIDGRNDLDWADSLAMDVKYTKDIRFTTDLGIVLRTVGKAFIRKEGISQEGVATREAFRGNSEEEQP
jgi:lipopolysaccharide/colanic/teichoic acid biosynthesis glycosyltransferase